MKVPWVGIVIVAAVAALWSPHALFHVHQPAGLTDHCWRSILPRGTL
jgi:hypothetical protein